jgi:hypothetical protein
MRHRAAKECAILERSKSGAEGILPAKALASVDPRLPLLFSMRSAFPMAFKPKPVWLNRYDIFCFTVFAVDLVYNPFL